MSYLAAKHFFKVLTRTTKSRHILQINESIRRLASYSVRPCLQSESRMDVSSKCHGSFKIHGHTTPMSCPFTRDYSSSIYMKVNAKGNPYFTLSKVTNHEVRVTLTSKGIEFREYQNDMPGIQRTQWTFFQYQNFRKLVLDGSVDRFLQNADSVEHVAQKQAHEKNNKSHKKDTQFPSFLDISVKKSVKAIKMVKTRIHMSDYYVNDQGTTVSGKQGIEMSVEAFQLLCQVVKKW